jgi:hypothetical protein
MSKVLKNNKKMFRKRNILFLWKAYKQRSASNCSFSEPNGERDSQRQVLIVRWEYWGGAVRGGGVFGGDRYRVETGADS